MGRWIGDRVADYGFSVGRLTFARLASVMSCAIPPMPMDNSSRTLMYNLDHGPDNHDCSRIISVVGIGG